MCVWGFLVSTKLRVVVVTSCGIWPEVQPGLSFPCALLVGCALLSTGQPWLSSQILHLQPRVRGFGPGAFSSQVLYLLQFASWWAGGALGREDALIHSFPAFPFLGLSSSHPSGKSWGKAVTVGSLGSVGKSSHSGVTGVALLVPVPSPASRGPSAQPNTPFLLCLLLPDNRQRERSAAGSPHRDFG